MLDGAQVEVTLAKPVDKDTYLRAPKLKTAFNVPAYYVPVDQYGTVMSLYPSYIPQQLSPPHKSVPFTLELHGNKTKNYTQRTVEPPNVIQ